MQSLPVHTCTTCSWLRAVLRAQERSRVKGLERVSGLMATAGMTQEVNNMLHCAVAAHIHDCWRVTTFLCLLSWQAVSGVLGKMGGNNSSVLTAGSMTGVHAGASGTSSSLPLKQHSNTGHLEFEDVLDSFAAASQDASPMCVP